MSNCPLVSVCVITYNSADYVLETLESIKSQTYSNIELIISDDSSKDETVSLCKKWIEKNFSRFTRTEIISPEKNTGTSANYNRAVNAANGAWIKFIDGDDLLLANCLKDNIDFIVQTPEAKIVFSEVLNFSNIKDKSTYYKFYYAKRREFFDLDVHDQLLRALYCNDMASASFFVNTKLIKDNPFDERFRLLEDWPKWIDLLEKGYRFYFFDKVTAMYRREESVMHSGSRYYSPLFVESLNSFFWIKLLGVIKLHNAQDAYDYNKKCLMWIDFAFAYLGNNRSKFKDHIFSVYKWFTRRFIHYKLY